MDYLVYVGVRMEGILFFGWRGYYGNLEVEVKGLLFWCRGFWVRFCICSDLSWGWEGLERTLY